ncbi:MAG: secondary thiamine-phosphate synthase enzyme YjbQ [Candidatus Geothermincolia bacterium]
MRVLNLRLEFKTEGDADIVEITGEVAELVRSSGLVNGLATVFVPGATGSVTTLEHEPGVCRDFRELFDAIAPVAKEYWHNQRGVDANGHAHVRAALLGPSITVPFEAGELLLGRWQQIVFIDFDEVPRDRQLIINVLGE